MNLQKNISNIPGWISNRKLIIFESDDWGAIRMSSAADFQKMLALGVKPCSEDEERYLRNDALASEGDLTGLFEVLDSVKDAKGNPAVFTAVSVVANPDFDAIRENGFQEYKYESFTETLKRYPAHTGSFKLWQEGYNNGLFVPQFHGREHLNVFHWLKALQVGEPDTLTAFNHRVYGISPREPLNNISYQAAFDFVDPMELDYQKDVIAGGLALFEQLHGYKASFFVPTNGPFSNKLLEITAQHGVKYVGAAKIQSEPVGFGNTKRVFHWLGQRNQFGQRFLTRNCFFEPNSNLQSDWVDSCLNDIKLSFRWNKPAVISSHRVNYIGWLNPANRDNSLKQLKVLLTKIIQLWPDVEFITSNQLGDLILESRK